MEYLHHTDFMRCSGIVNDEGLKRLLEPEAVDDCNKILFSQTQQGHDTLELTLAVTAYIRPYQDQAHSNPSMKPHLYLSSWWQVMAIKRARVSLLQAAAPGSLPSVPLI